MLNVAPALGIEGWMTEQELLYLAEEASKHRNIVEVGSYCGRSTRVLADHTPGIVHAIDPWDGERRHYKKFTHYNGDDTNFNQFLNYLHHHIKAGKVSIHRNTFDKVWIEKPDMIFIDAIHEYEPLRADIIHSLNMMKSGLLCGHDYAHYWPDVKEIVDEIFPAHGLIGTIWSKQL